MDWHKSHIWLIEVSFSVHEISHRFWMTELSFYWQKWPFFFWLWQNCLFTDRSDLFFFGRDRSVLLHVLFGHKCLFPFIISRIYFFFYKKKFNSFFYFSHRHFLLRATFSKFSNFYPWYVSFKEKKTPRERCFEYGE